MFLSLQINEHVYHSPLERVHTTAGTVVLRIADIRSVRDAANRMVTAQGERHPDYDHAIVETLDGQRYATRQSAAEIAAMIEERLPRHRGMHDHVLLGRIEARSTLAVQHHVDGMVQHVQSPLTALPAAD